MSQTKTTWFAHDGKMIFRLDNESHTVVATRIDHPKTICSILDMVMKLAPYERRAVIAMASDYEMKHMYPETQNKRKDRS